MAIFDPASARNFRKFAAGQMLMSSFFDVFEKLVIGFAVINLLAFLAVKDPATQGLLEIFFALELSFLFFFNFIRNFSQPVGDILSENTAEAFGEDEIKVIQDAVKIAEENKFTEIQPILLLAAIEQDDEGKYLLLRSGFGLEKDLSGLIADAILKIPRSDTSVAPKFTPEFVAVIDNARQNAVTNNRSAVDIGDFLIALIEKSEVFKQMMFEIKIEEADLQEIVAWRELLKDYRAKVNLPFYEKTVSGGIGKDWSYGYTRMLNQFARNLNTEIEFQGEAHLYGRKKRN